MQARVPINWHKHCLPERRHIFAAGDKHSSVQFRTQSHSPHRKASIDRIATLSMWSQSPRGGGKVQDDTTGLAQQRQVILWRMYYSLTAILRPNIQTKRQANRQSKRSNKIPKKNLSSLYDPHTEQRKRRRWLLLMEMVSLQVGAHKTLALFLPTLVQESVLISAWPKWICATVQRAKKYFRPICLVSRYTCWWTHNENPNCQMNGH